MTTKKLLFDITLTPIPSRDRSNRAAGNGPYDSSTFPRFLRLTPSNSIIPIGRTSRSPDKGFFATEYNGWFDSPVISREHAYMKLDWDDKLVLQDLNSMHGTFLNDRRLHPQQPARLVNDDVVAFGAEVHRAHDHVFPCCFRVNFTSKPWKGAEPERHDSPFNSQVPFPSKSPHASNADGVGDATRDQVGVAAPTNTFRVPSDDESDSDSDFAVYDGDFDSTRTPVESPEPEDQCSSDSAMADAAEGNADDACKKEGTPAPPETKKEEDHAESKPLLGPYGLPHMAVPWLCSSYEDTAVHSYSSEDDESDAPSEQPIDVERKEQDCADACQCEDSPSPSPSPLRSPSLSPLLEPTSHPGLNMYSNNFWADSPSADSMAAGPSSVNESSCGMSSIDLDSSSSSSDSSAKSMFEEESSETKTSEETEKPEEKFEMPTEMELLSMKNNFIKNSKNMENPQNPFDEPMEKLLEKPFGRMESPLEEFKSMDDLEKPFKRALSPPENFPKRMEDSFEKPFEMHEQKSETPLEHKPFESYVDKLLCTPDPVEPKPVEPRVHRFSDRKCSWITQNTRIAPEDCVAIPELQNARHLAPYLSGPLDKMAHSNSYTPKFSQEKSDLREVFLAREENRLRLMRDHNLTSQLSSLFRLPQHTPTAPKEEESSTPALEKPYYRPTPVRSVSIKDMLDTPSNSETPRSLKRNAAEMSDVVPEETDACQASAADDTVSPAQLSKAEGEMELEPVADEVAEAEAVADASPPTPVPASVPAPATAPATSSQTDEPRPKRLKRFAEAVGYATLGGVVASAGLFAALVSTAPEY